MPQPAALRLALDLAAMPVLAGVMRRQELPTGMFEVIKIAGRCAETCRLAETRTGETPEAIREAARLYLQTMLFGPAADSYRVLGVRRDSPQEVIGQHMRWLMKWLHPDREPDGWESALAERVSGAWQDLKSAERRAAYDRLHPARSADARHRSSHGPSLRSRQRIPWIGGPLHRPPAPPAQRYRLAIAVAASGALAVLMFTAWAPLWPWRVQGEADFAFGAESAIDAAAVDATIVGGASSGAGDH